jgi:hypothetical protein
MSRDRNALWVDIQRAAWLGKFGLQGYFMAPAINSDGEESLWIVCSELLDRRGVDMGNPSPQHERVGPLPPWFAHRTEWVLSGIRCGAPTRSGRPCRSRVEKQGLKCCFHRGGQR